YLIEFYCVDALASYPGFGIKSNNTGLGQFIKLTGRRYTETFSDYLKQQPILHTVTLSVSAVLTCLFLLLALQNKRERFLWLIVAFMVLICFATMLNIVTFGDTLAYKHYIVLSATIEFIGSVPFLMIPLILLNIFKRK